MNGRIIPYEDARVHVLSTAMKYAASVYEAMRAYWSDTDQQLYVFRLRDHLRRLAAVGQDRPDAAAGGSRPSRARDPRDHPRQRAPRGPPRAPDRLRRHRRRRAGLPRAGELRGGADPDRPLLRRRRPARRGELVGPHADNAIPPRVKAAANYQNSRLALLQAKTDGYDDAILLNSDGSVAEGPGYTLFLVRDDRPITAPVTSNILEGVTRATLLTLFREAIVGGAVGARDRPDRALHRRRGLLRRHRGRGDADPVDRPPSDRRGRRRAPDRQGPRRLLPGRSRRRAPTPSGARPSTRERRRTRGRAPAAGPDHAERAGPAVRREGGHADATLHPVPARVGAPGLPGRPRPRARWPRAPSRPRGRRS